MRILPLFFLFLPVLGLSASTKEALPEPPPDFHYTVYVCATDQEKAFGPQVWRWSNGASIRRVPVSCART